VALTLGLIVVLLKYFCFEILVLQGGSRDVSWLKQRSFSLYGQY
jgi:hypothetical protein